MKKVKKRIEKESKMKCVIYNGSSSGR